MEKNKENVTEVTKPTSEHLAMEILQQEKRKRKWQTAGLVLGMILLTAVTITEIVTGKMEKENLIEKNYQNDCDWRKLFGDYDFVSQDGSGFNNVNGGEQGDVINGTESEVEEGQE